MFFFISVFFVLPCCSKKAVEIVQSVTPTPPSDSSGKFLVWDITTLQKIAPQQLANIGYCGYPRMIQLKDESLLCIYEISGGNIICVNSKDVGKTWSDPIIVATNNNGINRAVPDILELADGSLLASYNLRPPVYDSAKHFAISTAKSYDGGNSWRDERLVYQASAKADDGCWEPAQIQLPSGEIQLYFSNEAIYTNSNEQNISMFRSGDNGLSWSASPQIVSFRNGKRDGMPVPIFLKNYNEILFSIEDNGSGQFTPSIIRNTLQENWVNFVDASSPNRSSALASSLASDNSFYAGAPFLRQLHTGETILSFQSTQQRNNQWDLSCMNVVIGDDNGRNFIHPSIPFNVPLNKMGLWNSHCVLKDNSVVALTSTNAYSSNNNVEVWMIKGHLVSR